MEMSGKNKGFAFISSSVKSVQPEGCLGDNRKGATGFHYPSLKSVHSSIQETFIKHLLYTRHGLGPGGGDTMLDKADKVPTLVDLPFSGGGGEQTVNK